MPPELLATKLKEDTVGDMVEVLQLVQVEPEVKYFVSDGTSTCTMKEAPCGMVRNMAKR